MSEDSKLSGSPRSKPTTRSSIRQSLNLASVGKAFADAISKDGREASKNAKKAKDASRRLSAVIPPKPAAPRTSMGDARPPQVLKRDNTPESKTVTRRRVSASFQRNSMDEQGTKPSETATPQAIALPRSSTLRPRTANNSALPKYRPKSVVIESSKPPSPVRTGTRRRFSSSDDEKKEQQKPQPGISPAEKKSRPISPLPHRAALKTSSVINSTPPATPRKAKPSTPSTTTSSPSRPTKFMKTVASTSLSSLPRPSSSTSSSSSFTPHTPKSSALKAALTRSAQEKMKTGNTPVKGSPHSPSRDSPSPLAARNRQTLKANASLSSNAGNMSHISEVNSEDSDEEDVALLLAPVAALGAPTPAMPRIQASRSRKHVIPQTPTREKSNVPTRRTQSQTVLPDARGRPSSLRPPQQPRSDRGARGSILSWEQLATEASRTLDEDDIGRMLADIPAPFQSGPASPSLSSQIEIPPSPCLSAIDSPGGYGSISQVLLPDVTPSPAVYPNSMRFSIGSDNSAVDSSTATFLRLQLAAAENLAKERLQQMQAMEEEIHNLKQAHVHQVEETAKQMAFMEKEDERAGYTASLEDQLRYERLNNEKLVEDAVMRIEDNAHILNDNALRSQRQNLEVTFSALLATMSWSSVQDSCNVELDLVRGERGVLSVFLTELDQICSTL